MVCIACGYENQTGNRFCGMCGTPLPHRPLTAPGAQNTWDFTRVPVENQRTGTSPSGSRAGIVLEKAGHESRDFDNAQAEAATPDDFTASTALSAEQPPEQAEAPVEELAPEVPFAEYVQNFRYVPPSDPDETTMRGDIALSEVVVTADAPASKAVKPPTPVEGPVLVSRDDVMDRLGLEVDGAGENGGERPRFLDVNEPPPLPEEAPVQASSAATSSFLGISEVPQVANEPVAARVEEEPRRRWWPIWLVVLFALVLAALGFLEWRARVGQTHHGPLEVVRAKLRSLTQSQAAAPPPIPVAAGPTSAGASAPAKKGDPGPLPQPATPSGAGSPRAATSKSQVAANPVVSSSAATSNTNAVNPPANTGKSTPNSGPSSAANPPGHAASNGAKSPAGSATPAAALPNSAANKQPAASVPASPVKPTPAAHTDYQDSLPKKTVLGEEELQKANNASDSPAEVAWLWKATAKGNPDAPVRLADMYIKGDGVPRSCEQAMVLLKTAAAKENSRARNRLASLYASGTCVSRNRVEAYRWLSSALKANPGSEWAQQNRDLLWQQMTPEERAAVGKNQ